MVDRPDIFKSCIKCVTADRVEKKKKIKGIIIIKKKVIFKVTTFTFNLFNYNGLANSNWY